MTQDKDMTALAQIALNHLKKGGFAMGADWEAAHQICQDHEDVQIMNRIHALCHRIEGDIPNARYWDRMGGQQTPKGGFAEEWEALNQSLEGA